MPRGAGLSLQGLWSRDPAPLYPKTGHFRESLPQNCCVLTKGGVGGKWGGQEGAPARAGSRGAQEGRVLHSGAGGCLKERWDGGKGGKRGWRKVKETPEEERDSAH